MEKSESENDSDCYESAEEEFEKIEKVLNQNKIKSECDVINSISSFHDAENTVAEVSRKEAPRNTVSYRKRPERMRRLDNTTSSKKEPHKLDILDPDVFLQDITMNLSKNINKSLCTIQQTSSNVKDLIMNSLPVSSVNEKSTFSYDDTDNLPMDVDTNSELHNSSECELISKGLVKCLSQGESENKQDTNKSLEDEINNLMKCSELNSGTHEGFILNEEVRTDTREAVVGNDDIADDVKNARPINESTEGKEETFFNFPNIESSILNKKLIPDILLKEVVDDEQQVKAEKLMNMAHSEIVNIIESKGCDLNENKSYIITRNLVQLSKELEIIPDSHNSSVSGKTNEKEWQKYKTGVNMPLTENRNNVWNDSLPNTNTNEGNDSWIKGESDDISEDQEEEMQPLECDLEALKRNLEKIVFQCGTENENEIKSFSVEPSIPEKISNAETAEATQDGWDDFDFSDHEIENDDDDDGPKSSEKPIVKNDPILTSLKAPTQTSKLGEEKINQKYVKGNIKEGESQSQTKGNENIIDAEKVEKAKIDEDPKGGVEEGESVANNNWDWDSWDEDTENEKEKTEPSRKVNIEKDSEINEFQEKWSGWDTFAQKQDERQGNWNLGSWSVNMLINKASAVTQGISTVLEAGLGAPDPETLARMEKQESLKRTEKNKTETEEEELPQKNSNDVIFPVFEFTNLVAGVTSKIVEHSKIQEIGSKVISGGLETLESFGKKTMEVLQEGDPGLKKKRALLLGSNKPVLSQVLKEAREKAENEDRRMEEKELFRKCQFETLFDDYQGMIHLEALEMLSTQCELKLEQIKSSLTTQEQEDVNAILQDVEQLCCLEDFHLDWDNFTNVEFKVSIDIAVTSLQQEISLAKILQVHDQVEKWLTESSVTKQSGIIVHQKAVSTFAELTAATVHQFHKTGELLSVKECRKTVEEVDALWKMTSVLCAELERLRGRFIKLCDESPDKDSIAEKIDVVLKNAVSYIKQAFHLLVPVIQVGAAI